LETSKSVTLTLDLEPLLQLILSRLKAVVDHDGAAVSGSSKMLYCSWPTRDRSLKMRSTTAGA
jgi:hypothetical protein